MSVIRHHSSLVRHVFPFISCSGFQFFRAANSVEVWTFVDISHIQRLWHIQHVEISFS